MVLARAWMEYEVRGLGAKGGRFSTYCLDTLVACVVNAFGRHLTSPVHALVQTWAFLVRFDWETQGISLRGPSPKFCGDTGAGTEARGAVLAGKLPPLPWAPLFDEAFLERMRDVHFKNSGPPIGAPATYGVGNACFDISRALPSGGVGNKRHHARRVDPMVVWDALNPDRNLGGSVRPASANRLVAAAAAALNAWKVATAEGQAPPAKGDLLRKFFPSVTRMFVGEQRGSPVWGGLSMKEPASSRLLQHP